MAENKTNNAEKININIMLTYKQYKDFYRFYYAYKYRVLKIVLAVASVFIILMALWFYAVNNMAMAFILLWLAVLMFVYPRNTYRSAAKPMKNKSQAIKISFFDTFLRENSTGEINRYNYEDIIKTKETTTYFYILFSGENGIIIPKADIKSQKAEDEIRNILEKINK